MDNNTIYQFQRTRAYNALNHNKIYDIKELVNWSKSDLLKKDKIGKACIRVYEHDLKELGLSFKEDEEIVFYGEFYNILGRAIRILYENGIIKNKYYSLLTDEDFETLSKYNSEDLIKIHGIGRKSLEAIRDFLKMHFNIL